MQSWSGNLRVEYNCQIINSDSDTKKFSFVLQLILKIPFHKNNLRPINYKTHLFNKNINQFYIIKIFMPVTNQLKFKVKPCSKQ